MLEISPPREVTLQQRHRATFDSADLAIVLSHYGVGVIESISEFRRGSRRSAKIGIVAERGKFLLKQRPSRLAKHDRVLFCHAVQRHLSDAGFPLAGLVHPHTKGPSFVEHGDHVYEMFEFISGHAYERTPTEAKEAGATLARFHILSQTMNIPKTLIAPKGDYHDAPTVRIGLCNIAPSLSAHDSFAGNDAELASIVHELLARYDRAAELVNGLGFASWLVQVVHADWHPGNLMFRDGKVAAVIDYDSVRLARPITDVATGALHFSFLAGEDPAHWPDELDETLFKAFVLGYESAIPLVAAQRAFVPPLMIQALIAECVPPISETGSVGRWSGFRVLQMARRKTAWLETQGRRLVESLDPT
ncbi:MAG: phosphotransferase [Planctomycetota bacterium]